MASVNMKENMRTKKTWCEGRGGTKIPCMPNKAKQMTVAALRTSNSLPGRDDQKCLLSLTISTLN